MDFSSLDISNRTHSKSITNIKKKQEYWAHDDDDGDGGSAGTNRMECGINIGNILIYPFRSIFFLHYSSDSNCDRDRV